MFSRCHSERRAAQSLWKWRMNRGKKKKICKNFTVNLTAGPFMRDINELCIHQLPAQRKRNRACLSVSFHTGKPLNLSGKNSTSWSTLITWVCAFRKDVFPDLTLCSCQTYSAHVYCITCFTTAVRVVKPPYCFRFSSWWSQYEVIQHRFDGHLISYLNSKTSDFAQCRVQAGVCLRVTEGPYQIVNPHSDIHDLQKECFLHNLYIHTHTYTRDL